MPPCNISPSFAKQSKTLLSCCGVRKNHLVPRRCRHASDPPNAAAFGSQRYLTNLTIWHDPRVVTTAAREEDHEQEGTVIMGSKEEAWAHDIVSKQKNEALFSKTLAGWRLTVENFIDRVAK